MRSARLTYRRPVQADIDNLHALDNDAEVMRWVNGGISISLDRFNAEIMPTYLEADSDLTGFWVIESGEDFLGWISLRRTERLDELSLGYRLVQRAWGRGFATEAATFFIEKVSLLSGISRISATTYEKNVGSQRVLEKSGFKLIKRFRLEDTQSDTSIQEGEAWDGDDLLYECLVFAGENSNHCLTTKLSSTMTPNNETACSSPVNTHDDQIIATATTDTGPATTTANATPAPTSQSTSYYAKGSIELAVETPVMMQRLEKRRKLTGGCNTMDGERLLIVLVGLPARGKSFIARKLLNYMTWRGNQCRIFNVGKYRRQTQTQQCGGGDGDVDNGDNRTNKNNQYQQKPTVTADFFDDSNEVAAKLRQEAAELALKDTLSWLEDGGGSAPTGGRSTSNNDNLVVGDDHSFSYQMSHIARRKYHRIAIFDATNSTHDRRTWILQQCATADERSGRRFGVLFLESICDDKELLEENFRVKISSCPDFNGMSELDALQDLQSRICKYESRYETITDQRLSYIKIFNLSSRLMVNHIYGRLAKVVLPAIMAWNTGSRPIYLCRAGETEAMKQFMIDRQQQEQEEEEQQQLSTKKRKVVSMLNLVEILNNRNRRKRSDRLGDRGRKFRDALCEFIEKEGEAFMKRKNRNVASPGHMDTGTSISGLHEDEDHPFEIESSPMAAAAMTNMPSNGSNVFPCLVMSSTMPRAVETATWNRSPFPVKDVSNLNPLDMGDFTGMDMVTIREQHPEWYAQLKRDPFLTRFPGGESYADLIDRLFSIIIDIEQQLGLAVVVSHVSTLQVLVSYFRSTPIHKCMDIEIPMHCVLKFVPLRGGGWLESRHELLPDGDTLETTSSVEDRPGGNPIWGDSRSCLPPKLGLEL